MDEATYKSRVVSRCSVGWHTERVDQDDLHVILTDFIKAGTSLDALKKALFYGRELVIAEETEPMPVEKVMSIIPSARDQRLIHALIGVATEGVEMVEAIAKLLLQGEPFDLVNLQEEFGDAEWYRTLGLSELGQTHGQNCAQNDAKLEARFGAVFDVDKALNRDVAAERRILEGDQA